MKALAVACCMLMGGCVVQTAEETEVSESAVTDMPKNAVVTFDLPTPEVWCACQVLVTNYTQNYDCGLATVLHSNFNDVHAAVCTHHDTACYGYCYVGAGTVGFLAPVSSSVTR